MGNYGEGIANSAVFRPAKIVDTVSPALAAMRKAKDKSSAEDDKTYEKYLDKIKVEGVHRLDQEDANTNVASALSDIQKAREQNPHSYKMPARDILSKLASSQQEMKQRNAQFNEIEKQYEEIKKAGGFTTKAQDAAIEKMRSGTWSDLDYNKTRDELGSVVTDPQKKSIAFNFVPQVNVRQVDQSTLSDPKYQTNMTFSKGRVNLPDGKQALVTSSGIPVTKTDAQAISKHSGQPVTSLEDINEQLLSDPAYLNRKVAEQYESGRLPAFQTMNDDQKRQAVTYNNLEELKKQAGVDTKMSVVSPFKKSDKKAKGGRGLDELLQAGTIAPRESMNISRDGWNKKGSADAEAKYVLPFKSTTSTVVTGGKDMIDLSTNRPVKDQEQFNLLPGTIKIIKVHGEWKPYVFGQKTDTRVSSTEGKPDYKVMGDVAVPLDKVANFLQSKPYEIPTDWVQDAVKRAKEEDELPGWHSPAGNKTEEPAGGKTFKNFHVKKQLKSVTVK